MSHSEIKIRHFLVKNYRNLVEAAKYGINKMRAKPSWLSSAFSEEGIVYSQRMKQKGLMKEKHHNKTEHGNIQHGHNKTKSQSHPL
jgi:hypothetical protein